MSTIENSSSSDTRRQYKVFVSSTYLDNKDRRKLVQDAIRDRALHKKAFPYAASFHSYRWCNPPTQGNSITLAPLAGLG